MTQETEVVESTIFEQASDPIEDGDLKDIINYVTMDTCDSANSWSIQSGNGVAISLLTDEPSVLEGTGAIKVTVPANTATIVKANFNAANIVGMRTVRIYIYAPGNQAFAGYISSNANNYNQTNMGNANSIGNMWSVLHWNIASGIGLTNPAAVILFALSIPSNANNQQYILDFLRAEEYHQLKISMGLEVKNLLPKVYLSFYTGTGNANNQTINIPRKGVPTSIEWFSDGRKPYIWMLGMGNNTVMAANASNDCRMTLITDVLMNVGDCGFVVTAALNVVSDTYRYRVTWQD